MNRSEEHEWRWADEHNRITALYRGESDRAVAALLAAAFLDEQLKSALQRVFIVESTSRAMAERLFEGHAPLSTFNSRIDVLFALGHVPRLIRDELYLIRKIRNEFAHHADVIDFKAGIIKDLCASLQTSH